MSKPKKIAVVTGARIGIGQAIAKELLKIGYHVVGSTRSLKQIKQKNEIEFYELDVRYQESVENFFKQVAQNHKKIDVLVNNAGVGHFRPFHEYTLKEWNEMLETQLSGRCVAGRLKPELHALNFAGLIYTRNKL